MRLWLTAGAGWGRIAYPRLCPQQPCGAAFMVRERAASMVEVPIGLGAAFELILACTPTDAELAECQQALCEWRGLLRTRPDADRRARGNLVHALLNHNDFLTIR